MVLLADFEWSAFNYKSEFKGNALQKIFRKK